MTRIGNLNHWEMLRIGRLRMSSQTTKSTIISVN